VGLALGWATDGTDKKRAISHAAPLNIPGLLLVVPVATPTRRIIHKNITEGYCFLNYRLVICTHQQRISKTRESGIEAKQESPGGAPVSNAENH